MGEMQSGLPRYIIVVIFSFAAFFVFYIAFVIVHIFDFILFGFHGMLFVKILVLGFPFGLAAVKFFIVEVGHQFSFHVVHHFIERCYKSVEILFVQENFMAFVAIAVFPTCAFSDGDKEVVTFGFFDIEEVGAAFSGSYAFGKYAFFLLAVTRVVISVAKSTTEATAIIAAAKAATIPETLVTVAKTAPVASSVAIIAATVAVTITIVAVSPFKIPEFHLSVCFMKECVKDLKQRYILERNIHYVLV